MLYTSVYKESEKAILGKLEHIFYNRTGENQISQLSGEVHTQVWPQIFMGLVGRLCRPV